MAAEKFINKYGTHRLKNKSKGYFAGVTHSILQVYGIVICAGKLKKEVRATVPQDMPL